MVSRANAKGVLEKTSCNQPTRKEKHRHTQRLTKTSRAHTSQTHVSLSNRPKRQVTMGASSTTLCGHQEFTNRQQSNLGGHRYSLVLFSWWLLLSFGFCLSGKPKPLRSQVLDNTVPTTSSYSREGNTTPSSFKPENSSPAKSIPPLFNTTIAKGTSLHPTPPSATPVVRPRKARPNVLKPVVLVLPPVHFPDPLPPLNSRTGFSPSFSYSKWRSPSHTIPRSSQDLLNDIVVKSRSLFWKINANMKVLHFVPGS